MAVYKADLKISSDKDVLEKTHGLEELKSKGKKEQMQLAVV